MININCYNISQFTLTNKTSINFWLQINFCHNSLLFLNIIYIYLGSLNRLKSILIIKKIKKKYIIHQQNVYLLLIKIIRSISKMVTI